MTLDSTSLLHLENSEGIQAEVPTPTETFNLMFRRVNELHGEGWCPQKAAETIPLLEQCAANINQQLRTATKKEDKEHLAYEAGFISNLAKFYKARISVHSENPSATETAKDTHFRHINRWGVRRNG